MDEDDEDPSNQESAVDDAKHSPELDDETMNELSGGETMADLTDDELQDVEDKNKKGTANNQHTADAVSSKTPPGSPPPALVQAYKDPDARIPISAAVPKIYLPTKSSSRTRTPKEGTSTPVPPAPQLPLLTPEEDALSDSDLPGPWIEGLPSPKEAECEDRADYLLQKRFEPMVDVQDVIASLTRFPFAQRSTESLYALAENTQRILKAWQDEYLVLDARVGVFVSFLASAIVTYPDRLLLIHTHPRNHAMVGVSLSTRSFLKI